MRMTKMRSVFAAVATIVAVIVLMAFAAHVLGYRDVPVLSSITGFFGM